MKNIQLYRRLFTLFILMLSFFVSAIEANPEFTLQNGFDGFSEGNGFLNLILSKKRSFHVESHGYKMSDGSFRLDQTITFQGKAPQTRFWIVKTSGPNKFQGTLSDASGFVSGVTNGSRLVLKYRIKGPLVMHQTLNLLSDGKTIDNVGKITMFGVPIGYLYETIIRKK